MIVLLSRMGRLHSYQFSNQTSKRITLKGPPPFPVGKEDRYFFKAELGRRSSRIEDVVFYEY